jgi:hypothetical protein
VSRIKTVAASELIALIGEQKANLICTHFKKASENK